MGLWHLHPKSQTAGLLAHPHHARLPVPTCGTVTFNPLFLVDPFQPIGISCVIGFFLAWSGPLKKQEHGVAYGTLSRDFGITATATMRRIFTAFPFHPAISNMRGREPDYDDSIICCFVERID